MLLRIDRLYTFTKAHLLSLLDQHTYLSSQCNDKKPLRGIFQDHFLLNTTRLSLADRHGNQVDISQALDMYLYVVCSL